MLNVQTSSLMFLETYNTDFNETGGPLEIEDKVNK